ncbi:uncharacterized protein Z519_10934 [Cladophialophora bantiana CBS 173.52]|uniref:Piwi domain-containing protein n=1 Tax=Cladophialophora bantiana (strain ATCC 10958 / CBS 173.52 / CDC B-1940 / NIH 8579) TaxID=1442370 RepID=A0A0D2HBR6_CLAB1|nr:uncharacterized protein Z519_10934 [Cladophialophora bantiana CBS 173.52]KIW88365.1 hypothetical protein Z519_10934 [Cladophialophora bantiana CBS 173.52]
MATVKGQMFYGIAPQPALPWSGPWETETGKVLEGKGGLYSILGISRSVRGSFCSPGFVDLNIYIKTLCFWQHGKVIEASQNQYPSSTPDRLNQLQNTCAGLCGEKTLRAKVSARRDSTPVTIICAIKRHYTDLKAPFQPPSAVLNHRNKDETISNNALPGCVVVDRSNYGQGSDFFLIGQKAIGGTTIPEHYNVLQNPHNYDIQDIARITYHLCCLFGRSRTAVGLCTSVYYADLVADRARCFVRPFYNPPREDDNPAKIFEDSELPQIRRCLEVHPNIQKHMVYI